MVNQARPVASHSAKELRLFGAKTHADDKGCLSVIEGTDLPFAIKRIYYIHSVPIGAIRGEHGHRTLEQIVMCLSGAVEMMISDGVEQQFVTLSNPATLLYVPAGRWRSVKFKEAGSVLCVLASQLFDSSDYIYDYEEFVEWKRSTAGKLHG